MSSKKKIKRFYPPAVMDVPLKCGMSIGMYKMVKAKTDNFSAYMRNLIMNDLKIDEYGKPRS